MDDDNKRNFNRDKRINKFKLDEELELQPSVFSYWAKVAADAKEEMDNEKNQLKKLEASIEIKIWTGKYKLPTDDAGKPIKLTGDIVKALVNNDEDVNVRRITVNELEKVSNKAKADEEAMQQKRSSLKHLTELYTKEYFSHTGADGSVRDKEVQDSTERRTGLNKKKKRSLED